MPLTLSGPSTRGVATPITLDSLICSICAPPYANWLTWLIRWVRQRLASSTLKPF